ncbi:UNVERIFIED_CONTAM: zinc finger protein [Trichonephila clavipes]
METPASFRKLLMTVDDNLLPGRHSTFVLRSSKDVGIFFSLFMLCVLLNLSPDKTENGNECFESTAKNVKRVIVSLKIGNYDVETNKMATSPNGIFNHCLSYMPNEKPEVCQICNKDFNHCGHSSSYLPIHTKKKTHVCKICNKGFVHKSDLNKHLRIHTKEKPHVCEICKKAFSQRSDLNRHLRIHTQEKPYICEICSKGFNHNNSLYLHLRIHTKEKPHICELCKKKS